MKMSQAFHDLSINFLAGVAKINTFKTLKCTVISTLMFEADVSQLFLLDLFLILSFLPN